MPASVFIDGAAGTTGLDIAERLGGRSDIALVVLDEARRKDPLARAEALRSADFAILCLPDQAAREAVALAARSAVRIIDASTAHRIDPAWTYGFAELAQGQRDRIAGAAAVSNPGCYPTGFLALVAPLVAQGLVGRDYPFAVNAVSGYSGGGKAMIERFEGGGPPAWRGYAFALDHKHVPEMQRHAGLAHPPLFAPAVVAGYRGMAVDVPLTRAGRADIAPLDELRAALRDHYAGSPVVEVGGLVRDGELLLAADAEPSDRLQLDLFASADGTQMRLVAVLDNLGKGAGGACVQNLNLMAGFDESMGLRL